jgi:hypothetical protein
MLMPEIIELLLERTRLSRCRMIWLLSLQQVVSPSHSSCVSPLALTGGRGGEVGGDGGGAKSYDGEKAWSSINHSMLSD